jgi:hypothetical protein
VEGESRRLELHSAKIFLLQWLEGVPGTRVHYPHSGARPRYLFIWKLVISGKAGKLDPPTEVYTHSTHGEGGNPF